MSGAFIKDGFVYVPLVEGGEPVDPASFRADVLDEDFYDWAREAMPAPPYAQDVWVYQAPAKWWRRLWWRARMLLGRIVPRLKPRPNMIMKGCVPTRYAPATGTLIAEDAQAECSIAYTYKEQG